MGQPVVSHFLILQPRERVVGNFPNELMSSAGAIVAAIEKKVGLQPRQEYTGPFCRGTDENC